MTTPAPPDHPRVGGPGPGRQSLLILGGGGDLTARLLLPGLDALVAAGDTLLPPPPAGDDTRGA